MVIFGCPKYEVPYYNRDPKRDHNFDNHPHASASECKFLLEGLQENLTSSYSGFLPSMAPVQHCKPCSDILKEISEFMMATFWHTGYRN